MIIEAFGVAEGTSLAGWRLGRCEFRPRLNLIVGASGAGKSKVLGSIFNLARFAVTDTMLGGCSAFVEFSLSGQKYRWDLKVDQAGPISTAVVSEEKLSLTEGRTILHRVGGATTLEGVKMPKLPLTSTALRVLREEDALKPIHAGFSSIRRRLFHGAELDNAKALQSVPRELVEQCKSGDPTLLYWHALSLSVIAKLLRDHFPDVFRVAAQHFKSVFRTVEDLRIADAQAIQVGLVASAPVLLLKEKGITEPTPIMEWSSGMVKVLLFIFDLLTQPRPSIYMIDEYENSLGVNAIDFFPSFAREVGEDIQLFITSHHPLLINAVPISDWIVLGRTGSRVQAMYGDELKERYGVSHHEQYVQLLNDPFYQRGER